MITRSFPYGQEPRGTSEVLSGVFHAFDAGEWDYHGRYDDPVRQLTDPAIRKIVESLSPALR